VPSQLREAGYGPSSGLPYCVECLVAADAGSMKDTVASEAVPMPNMTANTVRRIIVCSFVGSDEPTLRGVRDTTLRYIGTDARQAMEWSRVGPLSNRTDPPAREARGDIAGPAYAKRSRRATRWTTARARRCIVLPNFERLQVGPSRNLDTRFAAATKRSRPMGVA
jgi:hypothetical protein